MTSEHVLPNLTVDGQVVVDLLRSLGIEQWNDVHGIYIGPRTMHVEKFLRDENGKFYVDREHNDMASQTFTYFVSWPKKDDEAEEAV